MTTRFRAASIVLSTWVIASSAFGQARGIVPSRPAPAPKRSFVPAKVMFDTLPNGLRLAIVENHRLPVVAVRMGAVHVPDAPGKEGGWALMMNTLREGTTLRSAGQIADALELLGTEVVWPPLTLNGADVQYTTAKAAWEPTLAILADMWMNPAFPAEAVSRARSQQAINAVETLTSAAGRTMVRTFFGDGHPRARFPSEVSVRGLTRDDVVGLQARFLRPQNALLVVVGDVTPGAARAAAQKAFGSWTPTGDTIRFTNVPPADPRPTAIYLVDRPGAQLAVVFASERLPAAGSPDADVVDVINGVLGSVGTSGGSRMYDLFRTKHGLSYSPISLATWLADPQEGDWGQSATVPPEKADSAVVFLAQIIRELHGERAITDSELAFAKGSLVDQLSVSMATVGLTSGQVFQAALARRQADHFTTYSDRIGAITLDRARAVAAKYLDPDHLVLVVGGDRTRLEGPLRATGIPVVIVPPVIRP